MGQQSGNTQLRVREVNSSIEQNKREISKLLKDPPKSWRAMFLSEGISETPTIAQVLSLLEDTAGSNPSLERETSSVNPKTFIPPNSVRAEAMKGIQLSYDFNYPSYKGIGLARAIQLATQETVWERSLERMNAFFQRNKRYQELDGFGDDNNPSKSYMAWLNWGGTSGWNWVKSIL